jgi:hypothetical protein
MSVFLSGQLTVFFEDPFWVGVFERSCEGQIQVCKVTFGPEPKGAELYEFVTTFYHRLEFSEPIVDDKAISHKRINPKRLQRQIQQATREKGVRTKAQEAIQLQRESQKLERKQKTKAKREAEKKLAFELKQHKKKQKKRGH